MNFDVIIILMNILTATKRSKADKLESIRSNGMIPAVVYGARVENTLISVSSISFDKMFKLVGESNTIVLDIPGETAKDKSQKIDVLIHDVQVDPVKGFTRHIDFLAIDMNKPVEVAIPIEFVGIAPAEKDGLGVLVKVLHELEIEALPKDLPHSLSVDLSTIMTLEDQIHVKDIKLPNGVKMITAGDEAIAIMSLIKEEAEEVPVDLTSIEVEKKGKKEEEVIADTKE